LVSLRRRTIRNTHYPLEEAENDSNINGLASLLQTWLFFWTLHEVFGTVGITIEEADFVTNDALGAWLTTQALGKYLEMWKEKDALDSDTDVEAQGKGNLGLKKSMSGQKRKSRQMVKLVVKREAGKSWLVSIGRLRWQQNLSVSTLAPVSQNRL
jgi:hypothetical protein